MPLVTMADYGDGDIDVFIYPHLEHRLCGRLWNWLPRSIRRQWRNRIGKSYEKSIKALIAEHGGGKVRIYNAPGEKVLV